MVVVLAAAWVADSAVELVVGSAAEWAADLVVVSAAE